LVTSAAAAAAAVQQDEDMELATDEVLATTEDIVATDDGLEEANSSPGPLSTQLEHPHAAHMPTSRLAIASSAMESPIVDSQLQQQQQFDEGLPDQQLAVEAVVDEASEQQLGSLPSSSHMQMADAAMMLAAAQGNAGMCSTSSSGSYGHHTLLNPAAAGMQQPLAAGSRHVLLGASSRLGHSPSLALALALHQQQQVAMQQQYSACSSMQQPQQQPGSPLKAGNISLSTATASPVSHSSTHYFRMDQGSDAASYAASESAPGSPMLLGASSSCQLAANAAVARTGSGFPSLLSQQLQQQYAQQQQYMQLQHQHSLHGPSPLSLMGTADQQQAAPSTAMQQQQLAGLAGMQSLPAVAQGDVLQLVRSMATALGGVGPAYNLLSAINNSRAAAAAAAMAGSQPHSAELQQ
jgi:hypothetical protein